MSDLSGSEIIKVVYCMIGATEAYGDSYIDHDRLNNQKKLEELAEWVIAELCRNTKYTSRYEYSMKEIGEDARKFLGYLAEEYGLNDFVRKEE